ncbi:oxalurate catabolism protein HpxZ [Nevskia ramosa]|uniref:oxalurate catabolism protein HpxZ n=1 Tax=Nevskia ramosa TaxID=64002 RepID=UPI0003B72E8E|nr:oxalurate catabolism protein HpxZ [Nevskia ramosa]
MEPDSINRPEVLASLRAAFNAYEAALLRHDVAALDAFFDDDAQTVRYGVSELGYGIKAIRHYRATAAPVHPERKLRNIVIRSFGQDAGSACCEFLAPDTAMIGRQTQTWVRIAGAWRIVAAHVSLLDPERVLPS